MRNEVEFRPVGVVTTEGSPSTTVTEVTCGFRFVVVSNFIPIRSAELFMPNRLVIVVDVHYCVLIIYGRMVWASD